MSESSTEASTEARIQAIVDRAVERAIAALTRNLPPPGPQGPPAGNNGVNGWRIEDLGYFNPDLSDPADAPVKFLQNHTYYRDVYVFVERLKDLQAIKGEDLVRNNIHASLRGSALDWYTVELTDFERRSLRQLPLVDGWYTMLVNRFKLRPSEALGKLTTLSFAPAEVHQGRSVRAFAQAVFRYSQAADIRSQYNQITQAWTKLHPNLRRDVPEPTEKTTIAEFLSQLEAKESIWRDIAAAANRRGNFPNRDRGREYSFNPNSSLMKNTSYQSREFNYSANAYQRPYQNYPQIYNTWDKDLYSVQTPPDNHHVNHTEDQEEASFNDEAIEHNSPTVDSEYPDEPEYPCWQRHTDFSSNNTLHKHIREQHSDAAVKHPTMTTVTISKPRDIVVSSAKYTGPASYAFRSWKHVSTILILASKLTVDTCLDAGCAMTVIDKLLVKKLGLTPKATAPITVSGIGSRHQSTEYVIVEEDIPSRPGSKEKESCVAFLSLLNDSPVKSPSRKRFATIIILEKASELKERDPFHKLQKEFAIAYHAQTNGQSERTNATVEIMLRYFLAIIYSMTPDSASDFPFFIDDWPSCLPLLHAILNSSPSATTGRSPHEVMYGMTLGDPLRQLSSVPEGVMIQDFTLRDDAYEALKLAAVYMKERYDRTHTHKHFNVGDRVYVTLHEGRLAYRLELPLHWRIHPVISIAHLESAKEDPFDRPVPNHPDAVFSDEWEVERIVNKRTQRTKGGKHATEYLVRWTGYSPEYDQWYKEKDLSNAHEAIKDYEAKESTTKGSTT
ncbi:hypothetical protein V8E54_000628 [Elaphomyces granulatus]